MARKDALFQSIGRFSPGLADTGQFQPWLSGHRTVSASLRVPFAHWQDLFARIIFRNFTRCSSCFFLGFPSWFMGFIGRLFSFWKSLSKHSMNSNDWWILVPPPSSPTNFIDTTWARARQSFELPCRPSVPCERPSHPHWQDWAWLKMGYF